VVSLLPCSCGVRTTRMCICSRSEVYCQTLLASQLDFETYFARSSYTLASGEWLECSLARATARWSRRRGEPPSASQPPARGERSLLCHCSYVLTRRKGGASQPGLSRKNDHSTALRSTKSTEMCGAGNIHIMYCMRGLLRCACHAPPRAAVGPARAGASALAAEATQHRNLTRDRVVVFVEQVAQRGN
jgi:hypothetical protein